MSDFLYNLYLMALDASFWLVIGLVIGGLFKTLIPTSLLQKHLSQEGFWAVIKAAILGAPLPLCSCGVIPAALGLRSAGASKSATSSFLVSTPETGVDSVFVTYAMMGPFMAVARPIVAISSAIVTGTLVNVFDTNEADNKLNIHPDHSDSTKTNSCCDSEKIEKPIISSCSVDEKTSCCEPVKVDCCDSTAEGKLSFLQRIISGIKYAFTDLLDDIILWLVIGIIVAAAIHTFVPSEILIEYGKGWKGMILMLVIGIPMYVCATASTPLAAGFLLAGVSPGAVLVFLMAGPATNIATLGVIRQEMGQKTMGLYLLGIMSTALLSGYLVNYLVDAWSVDLVQYMQPQEGHMPWIFQALALGLLVVMSFRKIFIKR